MSILCENLLTIWKLIGSWKVVPLENDFMSSPLLLSTICKDIQTVGTWKNFNLNSYLQFAQVYLRSVIIYTIASGIDTLLSLDEITNLKILGHFFRVLIDLDMLQALRDRIVVESEMYAFFVYINYEKSPFL